MYEIQDDETGEWYLMVVADQPLNSLTSSVDANNNQNLIGQNGGISPSEVAKIVPNYQSYPTHNRNINGNLRASSADRPSGSTVRSFVLESK